MELKLNVYKGVKVVKTYTANDFVLTTGICEDILNLIDIDKLTTGGLSQEQLGFEIFNMVKKSFPAFKPFLQDIFEGMTDEELRQTKVKEVGQVIIQIVRYTVDELYSVGATKN